MREWNKYNPVPVSLIDGSLGAEQDENIAVAVTVEPDPQVPGAYRTKRVVEENQTTNKTTTTSFTYNVEGE